MVEDAPGRVLGRGAGRSVPRHPGERGWHTAPLPRSPGPPVEFVKRRRTIQTPVSRWNRRSTWPWPSIGSRGTELGNWCCACRHQGTGFLPYVSEVRGIMASMIEHKSRPTRRGLSRWRSWVQAGFLLVWLNPLLFHLQGFCGPVFHCYSCPLAAFACPIGIWPITARCTSCRYWRSGRCSPAARRWER